MEAAGILPTSQDLASVISFNSTNTTSSGGHTSLTPGSQQMSQASNTSNNSSTGDQPQQLGTKVGHVYLFSGYCRSNAFHFDDPFMPVHSCNFTVLFGVAKCLPTPPNVNLSK